MRNKKKPASNLPPVRVDATPAEPSSPGSGTVSRRDFLAATAVTGIALGAGPAASAGAQDSEASSSAAAPQGAVSSPLPTNEPFEMYEGTAAGAVLEQLRAAGVRMIFHTNTSGYVPFWEAVDRAGDVQVINVTHEGHAVAAAQGYAMASRTLGFFFGSGAGCTVINGGFMLGLLVRGVVVRKLAVRFFGVSEEEVRTAYMNVFLQYRSAFLILNVAPYIALRIMR